MSSRPTKKNLSREEQEVLTQWRAWLGHMVDGYEALGRAFGEGSLFELRYMKTGGLMPTATLQEGMRVFSEYLWRPSFAAPLADYRNFAAHADKILQNVKSGNPGRSLLEDARRRLFDKTGIIARSLSQDRSDDALAEIRKLWNQVLQDKGEMYRKTHLPNNKGIEFRSVAEVEREFLQSDGIVGQHLADAQKAFEQAKLVVAGAGKDALLAKATQTSAARVQGRR